MEYTSLIHDFAERTLRNLEHIEKQERLGVDQVYPVTQLWNSLLGCRQRSKMRPMRRSKTRPPVRAV